MSTVAAIIGLLSTILFGVFWLIINQALPGSVGGLVHTAALLMALLIGFVAFHNLSQQSHLNFLNTYYTPKCPLSLRRTPENSERYIMISGILNNASRKIGMATGIQRSVLGTLTLSAILILVFQIEILSAHFLGYSSTRALLASLPEWGKIILAATIGSFIHQGYAHLVGNLGVLLIVGSYVEYAYGHRSFYLAYIVIGYLSAWAPITLGTVGAVGASGVTYGLSSWMMVHAASQPLEMAYNGEIDWRVLHFIPLLVGIAQMKAAVTAVLFMTKNSGAGEVTHMFGALLGMVLGVKLIADRHGDTSIVQ